MPESAQFWLLGAAVSEDSEKVSSGLEGKGARIDAMTVAIAPVVDGRHRLIAGQRAFLRDQRRHLDEHLTQIHQGAWGSREIDAPQLLIAFLAPDGFKSLKKNGMGSA